MAGKNAKLDKIYDIFEKIGVPIDRDSIWDVQGTPVVKHKDVERLGAKLGIRWDKPTFVRTEAEEAVILVVGNIGDRMEWSIGEAKIGSNYRVSGKQASYVYAMAEKRAKDRVILKMADLHGDVYSEEEADEFKGGDNSRAASNNVQRADPKNLKNTGKKDPKEQLAKDEQLSEDLKDEIDQCKTVMEVGQFMSHKDTIADLQSLPEDMEADVRAYAKQRINDLGLGGEADEAA